MRWGFGARQEYRQSLSLCLSLCLSIRRVLDLNSDETVTKLFSSCSLRFLFFFSENFTFLSFPSLFPPFFLRLLDRVGELVLIPIDLIFTPPRRVGVVEWRWNMRIDASRSRATSLG